MTKRPIDPSTFDLWAALLSMPQPDNKYLDVPTISKPLGNGLASSENPDKDKEEEELGTTSHIDTMADYESIVASGASIRFIAVDVLIGGVLFINLNAGMVLVTSLVGVALQISASFVLTVMQIETSMERNEVRLSELQSCAAKTKATLSDVQMIVGKVVALGTELATSLSKTQATVIATNVTDLSNKTAITCSMVASAFSEVSTATTATIGMGTQLASDVTSMIGMLNTIKVNEMETTTMKMDVSATVSCTGGTFSGTGVVQAHEGAINLVN